MPRRAAKDAIKAIKKRLGGKSPNSQLHAIMVGTDVFERFLLDSLWVTASLSTSPSMRAGDSPQF